VIVNFDLQFHDVPTSRGTHEARADVRVVLIQGPNVTRVLIMVKNLVKQGENIGRKQGEGWIVEVGRNAFVGGEISDINP